MGGVLVYLVVGPSIEEDDGDEAAFFTVNHPEVVSGGECAEGFHFSFERVVLKDRVGAVVFKHQECRIHLPFLNDGQLGVGFQESSM